jgi:hypothetical protein
MKHLAATGICVISLLLLSGCTMQGAYEGVRRGARSECYNQPETEQARCLARTQESYEEYSRDRDSVPLEP